MKPIIGISKNLGKGFRVGIALPLLPEPKKSKREEANEKFVSDARARVENAVIKYAFSHGMLVTAGTMHRLPPDALEKINGPVESIEQNIQAVGDALRIYNDTGSVQQSTKEKIMRNVYEIERVTAANSGESDLMNRVESLKMERATKAKDSSSVAMLILVAGPIIGYAAGSWWPVLAGLAIGSFQQYRHKKTAVAARVKYLNERMAQANEQVVAGSVSLEDYVMGRV